MQNINSCNLNVQLSYGNFEAANELLYELL